MKRCTRCKIEKAEGDFSWRKTGVKRLTICKHCHSAATRKHYAKNRDRYLLYAHEQAERKRAENGKKLVEYLIDHPCIECGEPDPRVLVFHHRDLTQKGFGISERMTARWEFILEEIEKCDVLCANCHLRGHYVIEDGVRRWQSQPS